MITVEVAFRLFHGWPDKDSQIVEAAEKHGGRVGDCGAGLGFRDREFTFKTQGQADAFKEEISKLNVYVTVIAP